jgi:hypothetical protein
MKTCWVLSALGCLFVASPAPADLVTAYSVVGRVGAELRGFAQADVSRPSGTFVLSMLPADATVLRATLYAQDWNSSGNVQAMTANFDGQDLGAPVAPFASDIRSVFQLYSYQWDVTALVRGNGPYAASSDVGTDHYYADNFGMALAVVYSSPGLPFSKVSVNDGALQVASNNVRDSRSTTFEGSAGPSLLQFFTNVDDTFTSNEDILFNGVRIGGPIDANLGHYASLFQIPVTAIDGTNTATLFSPFDMFSWEVALLTTPAAAPNDPPGAPPAVPAPSTLALAGVGVGFAGLGRWFKRKRS